MTAAISMTPDREGPDAGADRAGGLGQLQEFVAAAVHDLRGFR